VRSPHRAIFLSCHSTQAARTVLAFAKLADVVANG